MKTAMGRKISNPAYFVRIYEWGKLVSITGSSQIIIQGISLLSGILVIRMLPTQEYGLYTLAYTMLGTMSVLSDGGISTGVLAQGGKSWNDEKKLGIVLTTGFELRKLFSYVSLSVTIPLLFYLLRKHDANIFTSILIVISIVPVFLSSLAGSLLQIALTLNQDIRSLQKNQLQVSIMRLVLLIAGLFITPWAFVAIIASAIPQIWGNREIRKLTAKYADWSAKPDPLIRKEILKAVKRILPGAVFFCLSGQITIWLISLFGNTTAVAKLGALGRLSMVLSVFSAMFATLIVPRFARLPDNRRLLLQRFLAILLGFVCLSGIIIGLVYLFPEEVLWVLGKEYSDLKNELLLSVTASCLGLIAGSMFSLSTSRSWTINPLISIPLSIAAIVAGVMILDVSSVLGVLKFNIFLMLVEVVMYLIYSLLKMGKISSQLSQATT